MALVTCPDCGSQLSDKAPNCPKCGRPRPKAEMHPACAILIVIGVFAGIIWWSGIFSDKRIPPTPTEIPSTKELKAEVHFTGTQFLITNKDNFDWTNVKLDLNGGSFSDGFIFTFDRIQAGSGITVGAAAFAKSDGMRFNPFSMKPVRLFISARTPKERMGCLMEWK